MYKFISALLMFSMIFSCSSSKKTEKKETDMKIKKELETNENTETNEVHFIDNKKRYPSMTENPQVKETYKIKDGKKQLYTKEYDFNNDGKTDMIIVYDSKKQIDKIYSDLDADLKHDAIDYYKGGKIQRRVLLNYITQKPYVIINYDSNGNVLSIETDTDLDGKIDLKSLYKNGIPYKYLIDSNGDGKFNITKEVKIKKSTDEGGK